MIRFEIEYYTVWGENLVLEISGRDFPMQYSNGGLWAVEIDAPALEHTEPVRYRYKVVKDGILSRVEWQWHSYSERKAEAGTIRDYWLDRPTSCNAFGSEHDFKAFDRAGWRGAGTAVPLFSLRTENSLGNGEFPDLKLLVDWAEQSGQSIIQLLPINDTTASFSMKDSSPYSAISAFALHPMFLNLPKAGLKQDAAYRRLKEKLDSLSQVDYEKVNRAKRRLALKLFKEKGESVLAGAEYTEFYEANKVWLLPYAVFCAIRDSKGSAEFGKWGEMSEYSTGKAQTYYKEHKNAVDLHLFIQYELHLQLKEAVDYAHSKGIAIKGDLPIGVARNSVELWCHPELFNTDSQCGAPPDNFSDYGQNWGFPTYNWEAMEKEDYWWWKSRLKKMSEYFDAFRIDHLLGFFRIWEIPSGEKNALRGHFSPALPCSESSLSSLFADLCRKNYAKRDSSDAARISESKLKGLFVEDPRRKGWWHPLISAHKTKAFKKLPYGIQERFMALHNEYFYRRNNDFWKWQALKKLPELIYSSGMLACGEDLGMIPASVPQVMESLNILSLEVQRLPKKAFTDFGNTDEYPYLSVCTTGSHDMSPLRCWWKELESGKRQQYYCQLLGYKGKAPADCNARICERIVSRHLSSPSMLAILPLQDWLSIDKDLRIADESKERINDPSDSSNCWCYRMHISLENLLRAKSFNAKVKRLIQKSGR